MQQKEKKSILSLIHACMEINYKQNKFSKYISEKLKFA